MATRNGTNRDDVLRGTDEDDRLDGRGGNDFIDGGDGDDLIEGGPGNDFIAHGRGDDRIEGGSGSDVVAYADSPSGIVVDLARGTASDGAGGTDQLEDIETLIGSAFDDEITGSEAAFELFAPGAGRDVVDGGGGFDLVAYDTADDSIRADLQRGVIEDGFGDTDRVERVDGVIGSRFDDVIRGDGANNNLGGRGGADLVRGAAGADTISGDAGSDRLLGQGGDDQISGGAGRDELRGSAGEDDLAGGGGRDRLAGGKDDDVLKGGPGADRLSGGGGADEFVYGDPSEGLDLITDLEPGRDIIRFVDLLRVDGPFAVSALFTPDPDNDRSVLAIATSATEGPEDVAVLRGVLDVTVQASVSGTDVVVEFIPDPLAG